MRASSWFLNAIIAPCSTTFCPHGSACSGRVIAMTSHSAHDSCVWLLKQSGESDGAWEWAREEKWPTYGPCAKESPGSALRAVRTHCLLESVSGFGCLKVFGFWVLKRMRIPPSMCIHCLRSGPEDLQESHILELQLGLWPPSSQHLPFCCSLHTPL